MKKIEQIKLNILDKYKNKKGNENIILSEPLIINYLLSYYIGFMAFDIKNDVDTDWILTDIKSGKIVEMWTLSETLKFKVNTISQNSFNDYNLFDEIRKDILAKNKLDQDKYTNYIYQTNKFHLIIKDILSQFENIINYITKQQFNKLEKNEYDELLRKIDDRLSKLEINKK